MQTVSWDDLSDNATLTFQILVKTASICGIPVYLYEYHISGTYGGRFYWGGVPEIEIGIPCAGSKADRLAVLFILLHEHAHTKQYGVVGRDGMRGIDARCSQSAYSTRPLERAANKYAVNTLIRLGIPPSIIKARLQKAGLGENAKAGWTRQQGRGFQ